MAEETIVDVPLFIEQRPVGGFQRRVALLCAAIVLMDGFDTQVVGYLVPAIAKSLQLTPQALTPVLASGLVGLMLGALGFGLLADRVGRKAVIILCAIFFGLCMLGTGTANSVPALVAWRFFTGLGLGGAMPNAIALTAEYAPHRRRATMVMMMFFGFSFGAAVAGLIAAPLLPRYGWPSVFFVGGCLPLLLAPLLLALLPESIRILTLRGTAGARVAGLLQRIDPSAAFAAATRFVIPEERAPGLPVRHLFREGRAPSTLLLWVMFFANLLCLFFLTSWLPTVMGRSGVDLRVAVIAASFLQFGGCLGTLVYGPLIDRFGAFAVLTAIYAAASIFIPLIGVTGLLLSPKSPLLFSAVPLSAVPIMAAISAAGFCIIGGQNAMNAAAAMVYPTYIRSTGVGWCLGVGRIGAILGPVLGGAMLAFGWPVVGMFAIAAIPALATTLATFVLGRVEARRAAAEHGAADAATHLAAASES